MHGFHLLNIPWGTDGNQSHKNEYLAAHCPALLVSGFWLCDAEPLDLAEFWAAGAEVTPQQMLTQDHILFSKQLSSL